MSYYDAVRDKIPTGKDKLGFQRYYPPCFYCGEAVYSWAYMPSAKYVCDKCRQAILDRKLNETVSVKEKRLNTAIKRISKVSKIECYEKGIKWVRNNLEHTGWFQSTEEIMVALELIRQNVKAHHQVKVFDYYVDFVLPEMKVALEIDGKIYHGADKQNKEIIRDELIVDKLGSDYEMIRIQTDNINKNVTKLLPAIHAVLKRRKSERVHSNAQKCT